MLGKLLGAATAAMLCAGAAQATMLVDETFNTVAVGTDAAQHITIGNWIVDSPVTLRHGGDVVEGKTVQCDGGCVDMRSIPGYYGRIYYKDIFTYAPGDKFTMTLTYSFDQIGEIGESFAALLNGAGGMVNFDDVTGNGENFGDWSETGLELYSDYMGDAGMRTDTWTWTARTAGSLRLYMEAGQAPGAWNIADEHGPILDGVTLDISPAVPEPTSWATAVIGFGVIGTAMRRRRGRAGATA
jgi:hypothetical protein